MEGSIFSHRGRLLALALLVLAVVAYAPVASAGWIWDDDSYVTHNPALTAPDALRHIWTPGATPQYYPLVFTTFWLESRVLGQGFAEAPLLFHLVNVLLHLASAYLLWWIVARLGIPAPWLAAAIFLVHPMQVESVAWVTERKNTLSLACGLVSLAAWLRYLDADPEKGESAGSWWGTAFGFFIAAMLAKTTMAALAPTLVAVHLWRRRSFDRNAVLAMAPFFLAGVPLGLFTAYLEKSHVGAAGGEFALSFVERLVLAPRSALFYVWTYLWPSGLAFIYPRWTVNAGSAVQWIPMLAWSAGCAVAVIAWRRGQRGPLLLAAVYFACLFPALGFIDVYPFRYSFVADHFAYLAAIPLSIGLAVTLQRAAGRLSQSIRAACGGALVLGLATLSFAHATSFHDEETLWRSSLAANPDAWMPSNNLAGIALRRAGRLIDAGDGAQGLEAAREAEALARRAIDLAPEQFTIWTNLSEALRLQQQFDQALAAADKASALAPGVADTHWLRGRLLEAKGELPAAIEAYTRAVEGPSGERATGQSGPGVRGRRLDLARALQKAGRDADAATIYAELLTADPRDALAAANLGMARLRLKDPVKARESFRAALDAADDESFAVRLMPMFIESLLTQPSDAALAKEAREVAEWLVERTRGEEPFSLALLARSQAAAGERENAVESAKQALSRTAGRPPEVEAEIRRQLEGIQ